jgi:hypothetical protein
MIVRLPNGCPVCHSALVFPSQIESDVLWCVVCEWRSGESRWVPVGYRVGHRTNVFDWVLR